ncbi:tissue factor-like [Centroberyx gerrardi]|uniref:tissue factor-like n=1 Tax=Centroberyx gerrardi TaxID=166262 RepID=UPI003AAFE33E
MAFLKTALYLGFCLSVWVMTTADGDFVPKAENVHWVSFDFKTILNWTSTPSHSTYTVMFSELADNWKESRGCIRISESECDMTNDLLPLDRTYTADIQSDPAGMDYDLEELPHTYSPNFNPFKESQIGAPSFTVETAEDNVTVRITDPLTSIYKDKKLLTVRDVLQHELKYKINYHKAGSTGKKETISDSSIAELLKLDAGQSYCFKVAAFIPSRPKATQLGAWSKQQCTQAQRSFLQELSVGALVGGLFVLLILIIIIVTVTVLCCTRCRRPRNKTLQTQATA